MIFVGSTGARYEASNARIRRPSSTTTSSPSKRPQCGSCPSSTRTSRSEMARILVDLPVGDPLREPVELEALDREEGRDELLAERLAQVDVGGEGVEGRPEVARQPCADVGPVAVAGHRVTEAELALDPVEA